MQQLEGDFIKFIAHKLGTGVLELASFLAAFFAPAGYVLAAVGMAIFIDTIVGRWRAKRKPEKGEVVSSKMTRVGLVNKSIGYMLVVLGAFLMDKAFMNEIVSFFFNVEFAVTKLAGLLFCWIEYSSVNESYEKVKGQSLGKALREFLKQVKIVKEDIKNIKKEKDCND